MEKLIVHGGNPLNGTVRVSGAKNAVLPIIVASMLGVGKSTLTEIPELADVHTVSEDALISSAIFSINGRSSSFKEDLISSGSETISMSLKSFSKWETIVFIAAEAQEWLPMMDTLWFWKLRAFNSWIKFSIVRYRFKLYVGAIVTKLVYFQASEMM